MKNYFIVGLTLNFRDFKNTYDCVEALLDDGAEHVVVWDNSEDNRESATLLANAWVNEHRVTLLVSAVNVGFSAAVNRGILWIKEHFTNSLVALINNDAKFIPGAIDILASALINDSMALISYPKIDHNGTVLGTVHYQRSFGIFSTRHLPDSAPYASGCAMMLMPDRIDGALFDETFFMYGEDIELGWRLVNVAGALHHVPKLLVHHLGSASSGMASQFYESRMVAAHLILGRKLAAGVADRSVLLLLRVFVLSLRSVLRAFRYKSWVPVSALIEGWRLAGGVDPLLERARLSLSHGDIYEISAISAKANQAIDNAKPTAISSIPCGSKKIG